MTRGRAAKIALGLSQGKSQIQACRDAGMSKNTAHKKGYIICKRPEVFDELVKLGVVVKDSEMGDAGKAVLVHKMAQFQSITNRELAPYVQMTLQAGKKIGAGSVQQVPQTQTNIQININPIERELMKQVMQELQQENPGKTILIQGVSDETLEIAGQDAPCDEGIQNGPTPLRLEAGADGQVAQASPCNRPQRAEESEERLDGLPGL